jgi:hypothetical protein
MNVETYASSLLPIATFVAVFLGIIARMAIWSLVRDFRLVDDESQQVVEPDERFVTAKNALLEAKYVEEQVRSAVETASNAVNDLTPESGDPLVSLELQNRLTTSALADSFNQLEFDSAIDAVKNISVPAKDAYKINKFITTNRTLLQQEQR